MKSRTLPFQGKYPGAHDQRGTDPGGEVGALAKQRPAGQINANIATANVYGTVIRDSGVCAGA